jgi:RND family efflux transporter MFP subunit
MALALTGCGDDEPEPQAQAVRPIKTFTIKDRQEYIRLVYPGKVEASSRVDLAFRVGGQLVALPVNMGDQVEEGQVVARLDKQDYLTKVRDLESRLQGAEASNKEAQRNFRRSQQLFEEDIISKSAYDKALAESQNAEAAVKSLEQQLKQARQDLEYTTLRAPFAGTIALTHVENHQTVQAQQPILSLEDLTALDIVVDVPEYVWSLIHKREKEDPERIGPVATFAVYPGRKFPLRFKEYETKANPQTQTYAITMTMDDPEDVNILPGMTAEVTGFVRGNGTSAGFSVPLPAVAAEPDGKPYVWVLNQDGMTVSRRTVETGTVNEDSITVTKGLEPGEVIAAAGAHYLSEGQKVRPINGKIGE